MTERSYFMRFFQFIFITTMVVVSINYFVDPFGITGAPRVPGLNEYKVDISSRVRLMKKYSPLMSQHNVLVVGNARSEIGINPAHHCFAANGMIVYNMGLPGANVRDQVSYAANVMNHQPVKAVFLSLDFTDFIFTRRKTGRYVQKTLWEHQERGFKYRADGEDNPAYLSGLVVDYYSALFSLDSLISSFKTLALQGKFASDRTAAGFNPARDYNGVLQVEGSSALFDQKMKDLREHFAVPWYLVDSEGGMDTSFDEVRRFLDLARQKQARVYLFINPLHEIFWTLLRDRGLTSLNEAWLEEIQKLVKDYPTDTVTLWDFSGDSPYIHEPVPAPGIKTGTLRWFWEPSHYREELGGLMIETMLSERCGTDEAFGKKLY